MRIVDLKIAALVLAIVAALFAGPGQTNAATPGTAEMADR